MAQLKWPGIAVPSVCVLIFFLSYTSQILFRSIDPGPLDRHQLIRFNVLLLCLHVCYFRSVVTDPGTIPRTSGVKGGNGEADEKENDGLAEGKGKEAKGRRWCRKCRAVKPTRAHHCKVCKRCIPKMDHHCPWTRNCVSYTTFPHFIRFLFYAVVCMSYLAYFLYERCSIIWENRNLPITYGPPIWALIHLFLLTVTNTLSLFALGILLIRNIWCLAVNTTTIEGWEIERHKALLRRARYFGGFLDAPDGTRVRIQRQEFPYDVGIWRNFCEGMGTWNPLMWLFPLEPTPKVERGLEFPVNGFEDPKVTWPPPDPDRMYRKGLTATAAEDTESLNQQHLDANLGPSETLAAFRRRQEDDLVRRRRPFASRVEAKAQRWEYTGYGDSESHSGSEDGYNDDKVRTKGIKDIDEEESGEEGWRNSEGERLRDFGVDEEVEFYDEEEGEDDDVPLGELLERKRRAREAAEGVRQFW